MMNDQRIRVCSFFSGIGFLDLGFENAGFEICFVNEYHQPFMNAYQFARRNKKPLMEPVYHNSTIEELVTKRKSAFTKIITEVARTELSMFIGGPPCPDFSVGGKNRGAEGDNGRLSQTYIDLVCKYQPTAFLFENVKGLWRTKRHREFYEALKTKLIARGYVLTERLTNALEFSVAQDRDRIFLLGVKKAFLRKKGFDDLTHFDWTENMQYPNARDLPKKNLLESNILPSPFPQNLTIQYWFEKNKVVTHPNAKHAFIPRAALSKFLNIDEGDDSRKSFKRLHRYRYSPTAAYGNNEVHIHPTQPRRISAAEALAIQSLPRSFHLPNHMTLTNMFKGIGNGVPYLLALGLAKSIKKQLLST